MAIGPLPTSPTRTMDAATYVATFNAWIAAMPQFITDCNAVATSMTLIAAGGAFAIPYLFSTTTTDADPGNGYLRLDNATQNLATTIRLDLTGSDGVLWSALLDQLTTSSSGVKSQVRLCKLADPTKYITFNVSAQATPSGYRNVTVVVTSSSSANPFANNDALLLYANRTGDIGPSGTILRRTTSSASSATPTPDINNYDLYELTALAAAPTFAAPTGTPANGQGLMIRMKDNGTPRALAWNAAYRASADLALPSTTVASKWLYVGFIYNSADSKWDLIAVLNNI